MTIVLAAIAGGISGAVSSWLISRSRWYQRYCQWVEQRMKSA